MTLIFSLDFLRQAHWFHHCGSRFEVIDRVTCGDGARVNVDPAVGLRDVELRLSLVPSSNNSWTTFFSAHEVLATKLGKKYSSASPCLVCVSNKLSYFLFINFMISISTLLIYISL